MLIPEKDMALCCSLVFATLEMELEASLGRWSFEALKIKKAIILLF